MLHTQQPVYGGNEGRDVSELLEACLQVYIILLPLRLLQTILWCICQMGLGVCVQNEHVEYTISPIMAEVTDNEVTFLFRGL